MRCELVFFVKLFPLLVRFLLEINFPFNTGPIEFNNKIALVYNLCNTFPLN